MYRILHFNGRKGNKMKKRLPRPVRVALVVAAAGFLLVAHEARAQIIVNGDFELGNFGWTTDYPEDGPPLFPPGGGNFMDIDHYVLTDNPYKDHNYAPSYKDHTTGSGLMMMVQGSRTPNQIVWSQTVSVEPNTPYRFSAFVSGWGSGPSGGGTVVPPGVAGNWQTAVLDFYFNGNLVGTHNGNATGGVWDEFSTDVDSGAASSTTLKIIDRNTVSSGNDFALDDISLAVVEKTVEIDIKPGSDPNSINLGSEGVIPIAILTTSVADGDSVDFDAADVDQSSLKLTGTAARVKG